MCKADMYQKDIFSINYKKLKEMGIKVLVFDLVLLLVVELLVEVDFLFDAVALSLTNFLVFAL